jgi:acetyltransferase-like isoleucine patch superfamily enzyme
VIDPTARIHATADLEADVGIGSGTSVWHRAQIRTGARIGRDVVIGRDVFIDEGVTLGDRVKVQNGALIYHGVTVADGVFIGPGAILTNDRRPRAMNAAGDLARADDWTVTPISIAVGASIGAGAIVVAGCDVGPRAMVGAGSVVTHDVPGHALVAGNPARRIGWVCVCGAGLVDSTGGRARGDRDPDMIGQPLVCPDCDRRYAFADDGATLQEQERSSIGSGAPA